MKDAENQHLEKMRDEDLIVILQQGNQKAFVILMRRYKEPITNFIFRFIGNYEDALDLAQETFVRLFKYSDKYVENAKFSTWLYTIASNLARSEYRRRKNRPVLSLNRKAGDDEPQEDWDVPDTEYMPDSRVDSTLIAQRVQKALMNISPTYREMIIMRDIQQMSYEEIVEITGTEMGTVKSRINRGRKQMQEELQDIYNEIFM